MFRGILAGNLPVVIMFLYKAQLFLFGLNKFMK